LGIRKSVESKQSEFRGEMVSEELGFFRAKTGQDANEILAAWSCDFFTSTNGSFCDTILVIIIGLPKVLHGKCESAKF